MRVHHVGYLVADIDAAVSEFMNIGFELSQAKMYDPARRVYICFMENNGVMIELVCPAEDCKLFTSLQKRIGNAPYHICYFPEAENAFDETVERLQSEGFFMVQPPEEAIALGGRRVAFLMSAETGLLEVLEANTAKEGLTDSKWLLQSTRHDTTRHDTTRPNIHALNMMISRLDKKQYLYAA